MKLSDLRKVVSNEAMLRFTVTSLPGNDGTYDSIETGDMLFFDADASLDGLEVTSLAAQNALMGKTDDLNDDVEKPVLLIPGQKDGESAETTENQTQPTVTAQENISSETSVSAGGGAVDMMKDIAARQQEANSAQK